jgi:hypothetical protein
MTQHSVRPGGVTKICQPGAPAVLVIAAAGALLPAGRAARARPAAPRAE